MSVPMTLSDLEGETQWFVESISGGSPQSPFDDRMRHGNITVIEINLINSSGNPTAVDLLIKFLTLVV